jgi:hypothetical protein
MEAYEEKAAQFTNPEDRKILGAVGIVVNSEGTFNS